MDVNKTDLPMPPAFTGALEAHPKAKAAFAKLPPSHQREWLKYLNEIKKPETLARNILKFIDKLES